MNQLTEAIRKTELCKNQSWFLHHDKASVHTSMLVREFLTKNEIVIMPLPPYSSGLGLGNKRKIEISAVGDSKKRVSVVFRELEKTLA